MLDVYYALPGTYILDLRDEDVMWCEHGTIVLPYDSFEGVPTKLLEIHKRHNVWLLERGFEIYRDVRLAKRRMLSWDKTYWKVESVRLTPRWAARYIFDRMFRGRGGPYKPGDWWLPKADLKDMPYTDHTRLTVDKAKHKVVWESHDPEGSGLHSTPHIRELFEFLIDFGYTRATGGVIASPAGVLGIGPLGETLSGMEDLTWKQQ